MKICEKCKKEFSTNANYKYHINRKTPCVKTEASKSADQYKHQCNRCDAKFSRKQHLLDHLNRKNPCTLKNPQPEEMELRALFEQLKEDNENLKSEMKQLCSKQQNGDTTNTYNNKYNTINSNNNISVNVYGSEDMSHITDAMYKACFKLMQRSVEKLFNMKHFSNHMKENQNIYISNLRDAYMMIYNAGRWNKVNKAITFNRIYYDLKDNLSNALDKMRDENTIDKKLDQQFSWFVEDDIDEEREERFKKMSCEIMACMAYNNRHFPMQIKNQMDKELKLSNV